LDIDPDEVKKRSGEFTISDMMLMPNINGITPLHASI